MAATSTCLHAQAVYVTCDRSCHLCKAGQLPGTTGDCLASIFLSARNGILFASLEFAAACFVCLHRLKLAGLFSSMPKHETALFNRKTSAEQQL
jgi:hypothetical protein